MACVNSQQDGPTYGTGSATRYNGYCECRECEEQREEAEAKEEAEAHNSSQDYSVIAALGFLLRGR